MTSDADQNIRPWQHDIHSAFKTSNVGHISYVPDGGHRGLIHLCEQDADIGTTVLTTEEEGVALSAGLWLGGKRSVVLMQSSGVGNCLNMFTLAENCRLPLVLLVTMRGEFAEFIPWQIPMGKRAGAALELMGFDVFRAEDPESVGEICSGALDHAFYSNRCVAVLLAQRLIGRKNWAK
ncbi:phosphonopyruvate decarboxylase [Burkholderia ambifaria]|jgi:sulfopyruvate decarboxylase alpha subunit|uniref:phosphonopyruvate decarboxylase n=1 Tax=Burkholderia ambifaria TaxID=152480 RepID=UPI000CFFEA89|nr:phosphonopyruvate decarboxylase [Burkholderia ambifaria]MBR8184694.1 phosphonopyruvate decarboxylase [Burkholderia ambifaria]PRF97312.1 phosphonopyruvate decarboxylase [Burkholderia ambifaria]